MDTLKQLNSQNNFNRKGVKHKTKDAELLYSCYLKLVSDLFKKTLCSLRLS